MKSLCINVYPGNKIHSNLLRGSLVLARQVITSNVILMIHKIQVDIQRRCDADPIKTPTEHAEFMWYASLRQRLYTHRNLFTPQQRVHLWAIFAHCMPCEEPGENDFSHLIEADEELNCWCKKEPTQKGNTNKVCIPSHRIS